MNWFTIAVFVSYGRWSRDARCYERQVTIARMSSEPNPSEQVATNTAAPRATAINLSAIIEIPPFATDQEARTGSLPADCARWGKWFQDGIGTWNARREGGGCHAFFSVGRASGFTL